MSSFDKAWRIVKEDESDKWSREYEEAHARGDQETMDRMNAENEADEPLSDEQLEDMFSEENMGWTGSPSSPDQRIVDMAHAAHGWGTMLANDHHESVYEDYTSDLAHPTAYGAHEGEGPHPYWEAKEKAEMLRDKIWQAGLAALGLKPSE